MPIIIPASAAVEVEGLKISTSNVLLGQVPTITDAGANEVPANISDPDHSLTYTSGISAVDFEVSYGAQSGISYVAISGHNVATLAHATIQLFDGVAMIDSVILKRNNTVMFTFSTRVFANLIVKFVTVPKTYQTSVSFIAAGKHITLPTGEQAGYKRNWLNRHTVQKTTTNFQVGPVSSMTQSKSLKGALSLPNSLVDVSRGEWQDFIDFAFDQPFFIKEVMELPESSYICFDPNFSTAAHGSTRNLDVIKLKFTVFNGLF